MKTILVIDSHCIGHIVKHTTKRLSFRGNNTGIIYGFLSKVLTLIEDIMPDIVVFAWDSKESIRKEMYPAYKLKTKTPDPETIKLNKIAFPQFDLLRDEILYSLGFKNNCIQDGYEADDIMADIAIKYEYDKIVIVTRDADLYQTITKNVSVYDPKDGSIMDLSAFKNKYEILPDEWEFVKAIGGCTSDNVKGVQGVGEKRAIKFLKGELKDTSKAYNKITDSSLQLIKNHQVVKLPIPWVPPNWESLTVGGDIDLSPINVDMDAFVEICNRYGMKSLLTGSSFERWGKFSGKNRKKIKK